MKNITQNNFNPLATVTSEPMSETFVISPRMSALNGTGVRETPSFFHKRKRTVDHSGMPMPFNAGSDLSMINTARDASQTFYGQKYIKKAVEPVPYTNHLKPFAEETIYEFNID